MSIKLSLITALVTSLLFTACGSSSKKSSSNVAKTNFGKVEISECFSSVMKDKGATCKYLTLKTDPENEKDTRAVKVYYSTLNPQESNTTLDPVVFLIGGPGDGGNLGLGEEFDSSTISSIVKKHKLIIVDYRGTGFCEPYADCSLNAEGSDADFNASLAVCTQKMKELDIKVTDYTTKKIARDIDKILETENIDKAILYGVSYGTRVALTMARDYPQRISSMVLDGVFSVEANGISQAEEAIFEKYADLDKQLKVKYPDDDLNGILNDLKDKDLSVLQFIAKTTITGIYQDNEEALNGTLESIKSLDKENLYKQLITELLPQVVYLDGAVDMVHAFSSFDITNIKGIANNNKVVKTINPKYKSREGVSTVMSYAIILSEEFNFIDEQKPNLFGFSGNVLDSLEGFQGGAPLPVEKLSVISEYFKVGKTDPIEKEPVTTDIPTILFSGGKDMQTTKSWAVNTQKYLANSRHFFFPIQDHAFTLSSGYASVIRDMFMEDYDINGSSYTEIDERENEQ